jgi:hypothetical protein
LLRWEGRVSAFRRKDDGSHELSFTENLTAMCGEGVQFRPESSEIWGPENDPLGEAQLGPECAPQWS